jgi:hypothetical protein
MRPDAVQLAEPDALKVGLQIPQVQDNRVPFGIATPAATHGTVPVAPDGYPASDDGNNQHRAQQADVHANDLRQRMEKEQK